MKLGNYYRAQIKNKVYLVSFEYFPISEGGLARHAKSVIDRLIKNKDYKAIIAAPNNKIKLKKNIITIPCTYFDNKYLCYLEFSLKVFFKFRSQFNTNSFVIFSSFSYFFIPILPKEFSLFIHSNGKRVFYTDYPSENLIERILRKCLYFLIYHWEAYLCKNAKKIFSVSPSIKDEIIYQYEVNKNKVIIINNALENNVFRKQNYDIKKRTKNLLYVGKLTYRKNIIDLINIYKLLSDIDAEFKLYIMGNCDKQYRKKIQYKIDEYKLNNKIFFYNYTNDSRLNQLYEKCSIFVSTSLLEGFGLVFLEAMSKGLPIISYYNLGMRRVYPIINNVNGYLIKPFNHNEFVSKILYLYKNNKIYEMMSKNSLKRVDDFSWDTSVKVLDESLNK